MALNLSTLPVEALSLILGQFCLHCSKAHNYDSLDGYFRRTAHEQQPDQPSWYSHDCRQALYSVCLVSRRLALIAQPILHHEFMAGYGDAWRSSHFSWTGRLASFLRTIAARPDLAALVKRVFIHPYLLRAVSEEEAQAMLQEVLVHAAAPGASVQLSEYLGPFDEFQKYINLPKGANLAGWKLVGALLALARGLERLSLQVKNLGGVPPAAFAALLRTLPGSSGLVLSKLKTLDVCPRNEGSWLSSLEHYATGVVEAVEACKGSLTTLNLHGCARIGSSNLQGLQTLRLSGSRFSDVGIATSLRSCRNPGLKSFFYEARSPLYHPGQPVEYYSGDGHFQPITAIQHLLPHAATLTSLHLDLRYRGETHAFIYSSGVDTGYFDIECLSSTQTSLSLFPALKYLFINVAAVCNTGPSSVNVDDDQDNDATLLTRLLPPNIEFLCLAAWVRESVKPRMTKALVYLAGTVGSGRGFTRLEKVRCDVEIMPMPMARDAGLEGSMVAQAFAVAGVDFGWQTWEVGGPTVRRGEGTPEPELDLHGPAEYEEMDGWELSSDGYLDGL